MFGESDDEESPRIGSPWDPLLSSSPSLETDIKRRLQSTSRLTPEIEEGNVEYKLKLLNPTPERFARLVTQLKWRLLEGGGQAYYELGVADSGQLVGLSRADLDRTVETLEAMAGEIGASVIIVKEVEVPGLKTIKQGSALGETKGGVDFTSAMSLNGAMRLPRRRHLLLGGGGGSDESERDTETPETPETELTTASDDAEEGDDAEAEADAEAEDEGMTFDIEVAEVYKPLPSLRRPHVPLVPNPGKVKGAVKKVKATVKQLPKAIDAEARALERRLRREARREERKRAVNCDEAESRDASPALAADLTENKINKVAGEDPDGGPRLIVEALVVRKPANDEVFSTLDDYSFLVG